MTAQGYLGYCVPCECHSHSTTCDVDTGRCIDCQDHTTGRLIVTTGKGKGKLQVKMDSCGYKVGITLARNFSVAEHRHL